MGLCLYMCTYFKIMWMYCTFPLSSPAIHHSCFFLFLVWHRSDDPSPAKVNRLRNPMCHLAGFRSTGGIYKPIPSGSSCRIYRSSPGKKDWSGWTDSSPATLGTRKFVSFSLNIKVSEKNRAGSKDRYLDDVKKRERQNSKGWNLGDGDWPSVWCPMIWGETPDLGGFMREFGR